MQKAETTETSSRSREFFQALFSAGWLRALLSVLLAFVLASILLVFTNERVLASTNIGEFFANAFQLIGDAYWAMFKGAIFNPDARNFDSMVAPITQTLFFATPLIAAGLGIALSFKTGLFNIGGMGQILVGAAAAGFVSFHLHLPVVIHLIAAIIAGVAAAALWGALVGFLKAKTGAHEVIVTIMLNYIALNFITWLMRTPVLQDPSAGGTPKTLPSDPNSVLPKILGDSFNLHLGFILVIGAAVLYWWIMNRSGMGYRFKAVGLNPEAAKTAGIPVGKTYVLAMLVSAAFVGLAGVNQALGSPHGFTPSVHAGIGWDAITVALLGASSAQGIFLAGILFGALKAAAPTMQVADVPSELLGVIQGLVVLFIAAPPLIQAIFRLPKGVEKSEQKTKRKLLKAAKPQVGKDEV